MTSSYRTPKFAKGQRVIVTHDLGPEVGTIHGVSRCLTSEVQVYHVQFDDRTFSAWPERCIVADVTDAELNYRPTLAERIAARAEDRRIAGAER